MTPTRSRLARWLVPVVIAAAVLAVTGLRASIADATPALPAISAAQLLVKVSQARVEHLSGVVRTSTDLGLPALPDTGGALSPQALLSGQHTLRVFLDGPDRQRVDLLGSLAETKVVHSGRDVWQWSSTTNKATHTRLPARPALRPAKAPAENALVGTPQALARQLLGIVEPTTTVSVGTAATVAGRPAYDLRLAPKTRDSLIRQADLYVDSATGLPLRVTVLAQGATKPAVDVGFSSIDLGRPATKVFRFSAPAGARVTEQSVPAPAAMVRHPGPEQASLPAGARVLGSGWSTVAQLRTGTLPADKQLQMLLRGAQPVRGTFGSGRVFGSALVTVLVTDDGRVFIGAVTPKALLRIADVAG